MSKVYERYKKELPDFERYLSHNGPKGCVKQIAAENHGKAHVLKLAEQILSHNTWQTDSALKKLLEKSVLLLQTKGFSAKKKARFSNILHKMHIGAPQGGKSPHLPHAKNPLRAPTPPERQLQQLHLAPTRSEQQPGRSTNTFHLPQRQLHPIPATPIRSCTQPAASRPQRRPQPVPSASIHPIEQPAVSRPPQRQAQHTSAAPIHPLAQLTMRLSLPQRQPQPVPSASIHPIAQPAIRQSLPQRRPQPIPPTPIRPPARPTIRQTLPQRRPQPIPSAPIHPIAQPAIRQLPPQRQPQPLLPSPLGRHRNYPAPAQVRAQRPANRPRTAMEQEAEIRRERQGNPHRKIEFATLFKAALQKVGPILVRRGIPKDEINSVSGYAYEAMIDWAILHLIQNSFQDENGNINLFADNNPTTFTINPRENLFDFQNKIPKLSREYHALTENQKRALEKMLEHKEAQPPQPDPEVLAIFKDFGDMNCVINTRIMSNNQEFNLNFHEAFRV